MKKIGLYLGCEPFSGGMFQYSQCMLDAVVDLPKDEFEVLVAYSSGAWEPHLVTQAVRFTRFPRTFFDRATASAWRQLHLPVSLWRRIARSFHPLSRRFHKSACDLWIFPSQEKWSYWAPVPALTAIHDLMHRYERRFPEVSANGMFEYREWVYGNICRFAKAVLVDSELGRRQVEESYGLSGSRIKVLPFAPPRYISAGLAAEQVAEKYSLPEKFVFYPAQFWEHKNHCGLVRAAKKIIGHAPDLKLVFVGAPKNGYGPVTQLVRDLDLTEHVVFLAYVPDEDMSGLYRNARCLVMPTFFGPTNIPPLEAFATGCPAAVSNIYGMPEQVADAALLFDPASDDAIADAILRLWTDDALCHELAARGVERLKALDQACFNLRILQILREVA